MANPNKAKEELSIKLFIANKELAFQNKEKEKRAAELVIANKELKKIIAERKKAEDALITLNEELEQRVKEKTETVLKTLEEKNIILESFGDGFFALDSNWTVIYWNRVAEQNLGVKKNDIIGKNLWEIFSGSEDTIAYRNHHQAMETKQAMHFEDYYPELNIWHEINSYPSENGLSIFFKDVTERKIVEEKLIKSNRMYAYVSAINQMIVKTKDETSLFNQACSIAIDIGKFKLAWIGMIDEETKKVIPLIHAGEVDGYLTKMAPISIEDIPEGRGPAGKSLREGRYIVSNDIENDPKMAPWKETTAERGYLSCIAFPIRKFGKVVGSYSLYAPVKNFFDEAEITLLKETVGNISFALENFEIAARHKVAEEKLEENYVLRHIAGDIAKLGGWNVNLEENRAFWSDEVAAIHEMPAGYAPLVEEGINFYAPEWRDKITEVFTNCVQIGISYDEDMEILTASGKRVWVRVIGEAVRDNNGKIVKIQGAFQDITERRIAENKLNVTSNELQRALNDINRIMDSSLDVICAVDAKGNFLKVSAASEVVWGYKPEELIGKPLINFVYHEDKEKTQLTSANVMTGNSLNFFENRYVRKDGALVPIEWSARWDEKDQIRYGVARDVTEKKRLQKAFEIERQQFFDLFSQAPSSMGVLSGPDHRFEMANPLYLQLIGKKDIIGKYVKDVLPEVAKQGFIDILDSVYRTGKTFSANEMLIKLDVENIGKPVDRYLNFIYQPHIGSDGEPDGILFFAVDVSEQVLSRKKIEESESRLKEAQALSHISNWGIDLATGVETWSDEFYNICGMNPGEIAPSSEAFLSFVHPEDAVYVQEAIQKTFETFAASHFFSRLLTSDGITKYVYSEWRFQLDENDKPIRLYGVLQDITERTLAKEKLELTQFTFDHAGDAIFWMTSDARIVDVNEAACHSLGYTRQELLRLSVPDIDPDFNVETWSAFFPELRKKLTIPIETKQLRKDGSLLTVEIRSNYIQYGNRELSCAFVRDISERKLTEEALLNSREEYKSFFEADLTGDFISTVDGKLLNCNPAFVEICGFTSKEEALNYDMSKLYANEGFRNEIIEKLKEKKMLTLFEADLKRPDGKIINVVANIIGEFDSKGNLKTFKGYIFDETKRKAAMTELRKLSVAVEQSTATVLITDIKGNIEYVNKKFTEVTGYSQKEVIGKNPRIFKSGRQSKEVYEQLWQNITSGKDWYGELLNKKKDGSLYWEQASISPIIDENGKITHFLGVHEDITEKKKNEIKLIKALEKSKESDKLKTAFLHNISHEIRTPMNAIIGFSNFLKDPELSFEKKNKYTDIVIKSSEQLLAIITDIIHIATIEAGQEKISEKEFKLNSLLKLVYEQFKEKILAKNIDFNLQLALPNEEDDIITDETKLLEIISNLVGNALKFTSKGFINMGYKVKENQFEIYVEDSGIGIPENMYEEIFDRFSQVEKTSTRFFGGSGLGLSISKGYAELLGGKINLQSVLGKGTIFYVTIPFKKVLKKDLNENVNTTKEIILEVTKTILVAEDEDYNFMLIEELLSYSNMKILRAENGKEAIDLFKSNPQIDLVLMDIKMPVMNGIEATKEIRKFAPNLPIIAQTAYSTTVDIQLIKEAGCNDILIKPFNREGLIAKINEFLGKVKSQNINY